MKMIKDPITLSAQTQNVLERIRTLELEYSDVLNSDSDETLPRWTEYHSKRVVLESALYNCMVMDLDLDEPDPRAN